MKSFKYLALAGIVAAFGATQASAWSGDLVKCNPTGPPVGLDVTFKKGLSCKDSTNKIGLKAKVKDGLGLNGCVGNVNAPWAEWQAGKFEKLAPADVANLGQAEVSLKGVTFGSCNFSGSDTSAGASAAGAVTFFNAAGDTKIKGAKLKFFGTVSGDAATYSADASGLITKGLGVGGNISIQVGIDLAAPENGAVLLCNTGGSCQDPNDPNDLGNLNPVTILKITTDNGLADSQLLISRGEPDPNDPNDDYDALP